MVEKMERVSENAQLTAEEGVKERGGESESDSDDEDEEEGAAAAVGGGGAAGM